MSKKDIRYTYEERMKELVGLVLKNKTVMKNLIKTFGIPKKKKEKNMLNTKKYENVLNWLEFLQLEQEVYKREYMEEIQEVVDSKKIKYVDKKQKLRNLQRRWDSANQQAATFNQVYEQLRSGKILERNWKDALTQLVVSEAKKFCDK